MGVVVPHLAMKFDPLFPAVAGQNEGGECQDIDEECD